MDPARRAMIEGRGPPPSRRDVTSPRHDPSTRISKPSSKSQPSAARNAARFLTEDEQSRQFIADEDKFVLQQSKKKADIRVREARAKPIDYLVYHLRHIDPDRDILEDDDQSPDISVPDPITVVEGLSLSDIHEVEADITSYHTLETNSRFKGYWKALLSLLSHQRIKLNPQSHEGRVMSSVGDDINRILAPKTLQQLEQLEKQIKTKLQSNEDIDIDYWEQLLRSLQAWKAKATIKKINEAVDEARKSLPPAQSAGQAPSSNAAAAPASATSRPQSTQTSSAPGNASSAAPPGTARFDQGDDGSSPATNALFDREAARGMSENEEVFAAEEALPSTSQPQWTDKYKPRKPRYFNRVQMGYEWNKYNQTHYDHDNPPPKVVQGYKFNIFYPELIDKTKAPTYKIIREHGRRRGESFAAAGEEDTCLIRFIAGPPYEDIAFRIVDREWDYSAKRERGFKSSFDKGILQLHFQFKKIFYRK
ncbi:conserved mid region of cactin domain-containing protein [Sarocladium implicatum]|nr:conserved mid region of cactin domain-containing protein [Sarocladium implicatum]